MELPSGTVTLLFSDLEGSTQLVQSLGDDWAVVLGRSRELCREVWSLHDGIEMGTEGDSFFVVFSTAEQAVLAAAEAQRALASEVWPGDARVAARIGVHTGSPDRHGEGYVGIDVHVAARVASAAHGGQVVLSSATAALVGSRMDDSLSLLDLGEHELKDIREPVRLHQLLVEGLRSEFPPLRTRSVKGNLPTLLTGLIGRDGELAEIRTLIGGGERLLTLTGPGGTGKSRLAVGAAASLTSNYEDGVYFVALAPVTEAATMWSAIAQVLELPPDAHTPQRFVERIRQRRMLLVLDNLEQLDAAGEVVGELLAGAPQVQVLATSRRPLRVAGEREHAVPPLSLPPEGAPPDEVAASDAVRMFAQYAGRVRPGFAVTPDNAQPVAALCRALDGLPLALELAAARVKMLTPAAILKRLDRALDIAASDSARPDRQRTLRQTIDWSYQLLSPEHQLVLDHLGVFAGGARLEAVEAVVPSELIGDAEVFDLISDLVDASFVTVGVDHDDEPRFGMLETIRMFALDRLQESGRYEEACRAHAQHYYEVAASLFLHRREVASRSTILSELDNFGELVARGAYGVVDRGHGDEPVASHRVVTLFAWVCQSARVYATAVNWSMAALETQVDDRDPIGRAGLKTLLSLVYLQLAEDDRCAVVAREAMSIARLSGLDEDASPDRPVWWYVPRSVLAHAGTTLAIAEVQRGRLDAARDAASEAVEASAGLSPLFVTYALSAVIDVESELENWPAAVRALEEIRAIDIVDDNNEWNDLWYEIRRATIDVLSGDGPTATARIGDLVDRLLLLDDPDLTVGAAEILAMAVPTHHFLVAARAYGAMDVHRHELALPVAEVTARQLAAATSRQRAFTTAEAWEAAVELGRTQDLVDLIRELVAVSSPD